MNEHDTDLAEYRARGSEAAFGRIVHRYTNLVFSTALRLLGGDRHRAEDVTQMVFADLARKASGLPGDVLLGGWLHRHTCFVAANVLRHERRREWRESQAMDMKALEDSSDHPLARIAPILDEAINELAETERKAIVLRFFEQVDFRRLGEAIGTSEDAARMRVNRALEKLEQLLRREGVSTSAAALGAVLSTNAVQAAPAALAAAITATALAGQTAMPTAAAIATSAMTMTTLQKTVVAVTVAVLSGTGIYQAQRNATLKRELRNVQQHQAASIEELERLRRERDQAGQRLASFESELNRLRSSGPELAKLRGQLAILRRNQAEMTNAVPVAEDMAFAERKLLVAKLQTLRGRLDAMPDRRIPELALLQEEDWLQVAKEASLETESGVRRAFSALRKRAKLEFADLLREAFREYAQANNDQLPPKLEALRPYFAEPVTDEMLARYRYDKSGTWSDMAPQDGLVSEQAPPVDLYDSRVSVGKESLMLDEANLPDDTLLRVFDAFFGGNYTNEPADWSVLEQYVQTPEEREALRRLTEGP